ncbi:MAG TPA: L,D-transpeptidase family protein, partial [Hyphomicrobiaceae bacterium]|nr:L,D-transpeptidase family protein [Hyphomicrobiaceae bacterium]
MLLKWSVAVFVGLAACDEGVPTAAAQSLRPATKVVRDTPVRPEGPLTIVVSLGTQKVTVYAAGRHWSEAAISSGRDGYETPRGVYSVLEKRRYHESNIYSGAPMPFMQRLTWSGIALHEGHLPGYRASHGCIRLPSSFAAALWEATKVGDRVVVVDAPVAPVDIRHPHLFVARPLPADEQEALRRAEADTRDPDTKGPSPDRHLSIFVSRKDKTVYVRRGFHPIFDAPVTIEAPEQPIGTHVFSAAELTDGGDGMRWTVVTVSSGRETRGNERVAALKRRGQTTDADAAPPTADATAAGALS